MKTLGICFGATSIQYAIVHHDPLFTSVEKCGRMVHDGQVHTTLRIILDATDMFEIDRVAVTGRAFRESVTLTAISEPQAVEAALSFTCREQAFPDLVVSLGGETQLVYRINSQGGISSVHSGNKCAAGTGEFFMQQIRRMGLSLADATARAALGTPHKIAGRCSVFCKSDCTHALNKGEPVENITAGLCHMMADKIDEQIKDLPGKHLMVIGGGTLNRTLLKVINTRHPGLTVPEQASTFEALGAALWACENDCIPVPDNLDDLTVTAPGSFATHTPLARARHLVSFRDMPYGKVCADDVCIVGLDVGSTTTKAVLIRSTDRAMLASVYLRTNGNPVEAARRCYTELERQTALVPVQIIGLGVTGSGRHIAGLHALTDAIINEISAHATAAAWFDPQVDTIFEIGGQDAKYTSLTNGVPSDYAMNEACSAGTGSFLEEAARESLNISTEQIGPLAMQGGCPPDFSDQCAAFIASDIKRASQEGVTREDILAGLVYSICLNYLNRVKGARPSGRTVFMQGGVCYNKAVPIAMAALMNMKIIVPPQPGLMGAFGVALEVSRRIELGLLNPSQFNLAHLAAREAVRCGNFTCAGGSEKCDRKCEIARYRIDGTLFAFGGACDRYYNERIKRPVETDELDLVALRQRLLFEDYGPQKPSLTNGIRPRHKTVGLNLSFATWSHFPLFANFFSQMGFEVFAGDGPGPASGNRTQASFCLPAEQAHSCFEALLRMDCDYLFLPQIMQVPVENVPTYSRLCVFAQGEPYYLKTTFRREIEKSQVSILSPVLKMQHSYEDGTDAMAAMASRLGVSEKETLRAWSYACDKQRAFERELVRLGTKALHYLDTHPDRFGVVLFGRPYNAFAGTANMGIPHKVASRGLMIIPHDMLPSAHHEVDSKMFWANGQKIMKSAQFVSQRHNLFGIFITNFSCGPDSFLLGYYRKAMGDKPSLTLELDQHTADAGIDTRIDAAIGIMSAYRRIHAGTKVVELPPYTAARVVREGEMVVYSTAGERIRISDPRIELVLPSMGQRFSCAVAAVMRGRGQRAVALPVATRTELSKGKQIASCKECLPYLVTSGSFLRYLEERTPGTISILMMATGGGPCRLGQYFRAFEDVIEKHRLPDVAMLPLSDENSYLGMGSRTLLRAWQAIILADIFEEIRSMLAVAARDPEDAIRQLEAMWKEVLCYFEGKLSVRFSTLVSLIAGRLRHLPMAHNPHDVPVVSLVGEIFVRRDEFSRKNIVSYLENRGFRVRIAPLAEYPLYSNYVVHSGLGERQFSMPELLKMKLTARVQHWWERHIKTIMASSGLYSFEMIDVAQTIDGVGHLVDHNFRGETILTIGLAMREILNDSCGIISIGPFGCMPSRMAEAILKKEMNVEGKARMPGWKDRVIAFDDIETFPFLSIETDGTPFPQLVEANLEAFILQAGRVHRRLMELAGRSTTISSQKLARQAIEA